MRTPKKAAAAFSAAILISSAGAVAFADDGDKVAKSMSHEGTTTGNDILCDADADHR